MDEFHTNPDREKVKKSVKQERCEPQEDSPINALFQGRLANAARARQNDYTSFIEVS
jgi:hypothetical protein